MLLEHLLSYKQSEKVVRRLESKLSVLRCHYRFVGGLSNIQKMKVQFVTVSPVSKSGSHTYNPQHEQGLVVLFRNSHYNFK
jgi:hypothetical protein